MKSLRLLFALAIAGVLAVPFAQAGDAKGECKDQAAQCCECSKECKEAKGGKECSKDMECCCKAKCEKPAEGEKKDTKVEAPKT